MKGAGALRARMFFPLVAVCALTVMACLLLYLFDNKYTAAGPRGSEGVLALDGDALAEHPVLFLVEGWEYYGGQLLAPEDFAKEPPAPDAYIYIGQYGGLEAGNHATSPHGSATYRMRIQIPDEQREYLLEMPEIFSAYRLYVNGEEALALGEPDPQAYRPETGNRTVHIKAGGEIELLVAVSDFSHLYSGMVYPPAFGGPAAVTSLLNTRLILRSLLMAFALAVGLLSVLVGLWGKRAAIPLLYGLLCLCFMGYTSYPLLRTLTTGPPALYAIENLCFCAMLIVVMLLQRTLYGGRERWSRWFIGFGAGMCVFSALLPLLLPGGSLVVMGAYSLLISIYEIATAVFTTLTAVFALLGGRPHSLVLLAGFLVFDTALVMDRILPLHEPIATGWFYELAGFVLVLCLGAAVGLEMAGKYRENAVLTERHAGMERLAWMQKENYALLMESVEEAKIARHDLRHHFAVIDGFLRHREYDKLSAYVAEYGAGMPPDEPLAYSRNIVADVLLRHYAAAAQENGVGFSAEVAMERETTVADADLCAVLSNLLENALEACLRMEGEGRFIEITLSQKKAALSVFMQNSAVDASPQQGGFPSAKAPGRTGYGLSSVAAVARRYGGEADFTYDREAGVFTSTVLLMNGAGK